MFDGLGLIIVSASSLILYLYEASKRQAAEAAIDEIIDEIITLKIKNERLAFALYGKQQMERMEEDNV